MNKTIKAAVAGALLAVGFAAQAATVTLTSATVNDVTHLTSGGGLSLAGFNTSLGTLTSAQFTIYSTISGTLKAENAANYAVDTTVGAGGLLSVSGAVSFSGRTVYSEVMHLGAVDYDIDNDDPDFAGTGGKTVVFASKAASATSQVYSGSSLSAFTSGVPLTFTLSGVALGTGDGNADYLAFSTVNAKVSVTYTYTPTTPVPEPETYGMLLAGLGLMGVIARRKAKQAA